MIRRLLLSFLCAGLLSGSAAALETPKGSRFDPRIKYVTYNPRDVVKVVAFPGIASQIVFADGEEVLDIVSGFSGAWEFADRRNHLYLKPKRDDADTNLIVTTNKRMYVFQLDLLKHTENNKTKSLEYNPTVAFRIEFRYPQDEQKRRQEATAREEALRRLNLKNPPVNWSYTKQARDEGSRDIEPSIAYDDGRFTYLKFPNNRTIPAVFVMMADGQESLINTHMDGDWLVIHRVAREFRLRLGDAVVGIYNEQFDMDGLPAKSGMTVEGLRREVIQ